MSLVNITVYHSPDEIERYKESNITAFLTEKYHLLKDGYRIYDGSASLSTDITNDQKAIVKSRSLVLLKPSAGAALIPIAVAVIAAVAVVLIMPMPEPPSTKNQNQQSETNTLGDRQNKYNKDGRVDDIWGTVNGHIPSMIERPIRRYEDSIEIENFTVLIGSGNYVESNHKDGESLISRISRAKYNSFESGKSPNAGDQPTLQIGGLITRKPVISESSKELSVTELLPPNDLTSPAYQWELRGYDNDFELKVSNPDSDTDLTDVFSVGDIVSLSDFNVTSENGFFSVKLASGAGEPISIDSVLIHDISTYIYEVRLVSKEVLTLYYPDDIDPETKQLIKDYNSPIINEYYTYSNGNISLYKLDNPIDYIYVIGEQVVSYTTSTLTPAISGLRPGVIGPYTIPESASHYVLNFVAPGGFFNLKDGNPEAFTANIKINFEEIDEDGSPTGNRHIINQSISSNPDNIRQQSAITVEGVKPFSNCRVECSRTTDRIKQDGYVTMDKVNWGGFFFYREIPNDHDYGDCTIAQVEIRATNPAQNVQQRQINLDVTRKINKYIGNGNFVYEACDTFAETAIAIALHPKIGRLSLNEIDADTFLIVQQQLIEYYGYSDFVKCGYNIDSNKLRFQEIFKLFCDGVRCEAYSLNAVYKIYPKIARDISSKQFTHRNKIAGKDKRSRAFGIRREFDSVIVKYRSNEKKEQLEIKRSITGTYDNPMNVTLSTCVLESQATIRANYEINLLKNQRDNVEFESDSIGLLTVPGERVDNVDYTRINKRDDNNGTLKIYSGQVEQMEGLTLQLSEPVYFDSGKTHTIRFTTRKGGVSEAIPCTEGNSSYHIVLSYLPSDSIYTGYAASKTDYTFASDDMRNSLPVMVQDITSGGNSKGVDTRKIKAINYSDAYFADDQMYAV